MRLTVAATLIVTAALCLGSSGCTGSQSKRDPAAEKSAAAKVKEAMAAQTAAEEQHRAELRAAATQGKLSSINSVCPVTGDPVDPAITPVTVELMLTNPTEIIAVGVATEAAADSVRRNPERYAAAAKHNRQARSASEVSH